MPSPSKEKKIILPNRHLPLPRFRPIIAAYSTGSFERIIRGKLLNAFLLDNRRGKTLNLYRDNFSSKNKHIKPDCIRTEHTRWLREIYV